VSVSMSSLLIHLININEVNIQLIHFKCINEISILLTYFKLVYSFLKFTWLQGSLTFKFNDECCKQS